MAARLIVFFVRCSSSRPLCVVGMVRLKAIHGNSHHIHQLIRVNDSVQSFFVNVYQVMHDP